MGMTLSWHNVLPRDMYFHKNRTDRLQRGLNCLKTIQPRQRGVGGGINIVLELKKNRAGGGHTF